MTDTTPAPAPGHPAGCCCGECAVRREHDDKDPRHQRCAEHGRCLACDGCERCEMEAERSSEIGTLVKDLPGLVREAEHAAIKVQASFDRLTVLYDIELAEGPDGADAMRKLRAIQEQFRDVRRIADARWKLEREYEIAFAAAEDDVPEFDDDVVVGFTRDQVNQWAGRRLTDDELAQVGDQAALGSIPAAVKAIAASLRTAGLASCGHPANEDGECGCASWPERAPVPSLREGPPPAVEQNPEV